MDGMHLVLCALLLSVALFVVLLPAFEAIFGPIDDSRNIEDDQSSSSSSCPSQVSSHCDDEDDGDDDDEDEYYRGGVIRADFDCIESTFLHHRSRTFEPPPSPHGHVRRGGGRYLRGMDTIHEEGNDDDE